MHFGPSHVIKTILSFITDAFEVQIIVVRESFMHALLLIKLHCMTPVRCRGDGDKVESAIPYQTKVCRRGES